MLVCNKNLSFVCSRVKTDTVEEIRRLRFTVYGPVSPADLKELFSDDAFYFYDKTSGRMPDTDNTEMVGLRIDYNADSTCKIIIKLTQKGAVDDEG